ncbi:BolA/IbaG family iron-sulfur metabolism protein [Pseudocolwellia sp. AS88]|jgi:BolA protein|uniref:BolA/IbaG family iron-sulfur metabolism protein n=1 Tax=Pseudocolwellia TaxID=2848177 RepID=UPI0026EE6F20|nr:BolA/IbaG family iron-sulfur metabolism protein [Pseudocolwellia sp. AS88]MDO7085868.1 BolA/IbaG family iron-sulfur metabolism protein [Pseudocolwellia sp. AS88]
MTIELLIEKKLINAFSPLHIDITKEDLLFELPNTEQFHFNVVIISTQFEGLRIKERHEAINRILVKELIENIPVLTLHTYTEKEWIYKYSSLPLFMHSTYTSREIA